jgi:site-specific DNA-cytosine methylase
MIGNAVPVELVYLIAKTVKGAIDNSNNYSIERAS